MPLIGRVAREQDGSVVVAVVSLTLMLMLGIATYSAVGTQTRLSGQERVRESAFNLSEGALNAQAYVIGRLGAGSLARAFPSECSEQAQVTLCPDTERIAQSFDSSLQTDYANGGTSWSTAVRDNGTGTFYDASVEGQPPYDANNDNQVWVRASATVRGKTRTIVALVKVELQTVQLPRYALVAGKFSTTNRGAKLILDTSGSLGIAVRCSEGLSSPDCLDYQADKGQVSPDNVQLSYPNPKAISDSDLVGLENYAKSKGSYYTSCPANPSGAVVVVESGNCSYTASVPGPCCNTVAEPGLFIVKDGTFTLGGNLEFNGIVYARNHQSSTGDVVTVSGTALVRGAVMVDGGGGMAAGSSGVNIVFHAGPFEAPRAVGTAGIVQNTWREITG